MKADHWVLLNGREENGKIILEPHSSYDAEKVAKRIKNGRFQLRAQIAQVRSLPQLRLYWPWIRLVVENSPHFNTEQALHKLLLVACGITEPLIDLEGNISMIPSSIAFDAMGQEEFETYFDAAQQVVSTNILPGVDLKTLMSRAKESCNWKEAA